MILLHWLTLPTVQYVLAYSTVHPGPCHTSTDAKLLH